MTRSEARQLKQDNPEAVIVRIDRAPTDMLWYLTKIGEYYEVYVGSNHNYWELSEDKKTFGKNSRSISKNNCTVQTIATLSDPSAQSIAPSEAPSLPVTVFKCDTCKFKSHYTTGGDEYPAYARLMICTKGHWENAPEKPEPMEHDPWIDCTDYSANQPDTTQAEKGKVEEFDIFNIKSDESDFTPPSFTKDEFISKAKAVLDRVEKAYGACWKDVDPEDENAPECPRCHGFLYIEQGGVADVECPSCRGTGVDVERTLNAEELAEEITDIVCDTDFNDLRFATISPTSAPHVAEPTAQEIANNLKILYTTEYAHGESHQYPYIDKEKLAQDIQSHADNQAIDLLEWAGKKGYRFLESKGLWIRLTDSSTTTSADLLTMYKNKK